MKAAALLLLSLGVLADGVLEEPWMNLGQVVEGGSPGGTQEDPSTGSRRQVFKRVWRPGAGPDWNMLLIRKVEQSSLRMILLFIRMKNLQRSQSKRENEWQKMERSLDRTEKEWLWAENFLAPFTMYGMRVQRRMPFKSILRVG